MKLLKFFKHSNEYFSLSFRCLCNYYNELHKWYKGHFSTSKPTNPKFSSQFTLEDIEDYVNGHKAREYINESFYFFTQRHLLLFGFSWRDFTAIQLKVIWCLNSRKTEQWALLRTSGCEYVSCLHLWLKNDSQVIKGEGHQVWNFCGDWKKRPRRCEALVKQLWLIR